MQVTGTSSTTSSYVIDMSGSGIFHTNKTSKRMEQLNQQRAAEMEREMKIRENEEKRIEVLNNRINDIRDDQDMEREEKDTKIEDLSNEIQMIYENRAEREQMAAEREMKRREIEMQEKIREQEKANRQAKAKSNDPDTESAIQREDMNGMVKLAVSADGMRKLEHTKSINEAEAAQLKNNIENDTGLTQIGLYKTLKTNLNETDFPNSFRSRNLTKLREGILKLESAISNEIGKLNDVTKEWAEDIEEIQKSAVDESKKEEERKSGKGKNERADTEPTANNTVNQEYADRLKAARAIIELLRKDPSRITDFHPQADITKKPVSGQEAD